MNKYCIYFVHIFLLFLDVKLVGSKSTANQRAINVNAPEEISFDQMTMFTLSMPCTYLVSPIDTNIDRPTQSLKFIS